MNPCLWVSTQILACLGTQVNKNVVNISAPFRLHKIGKRTGKWRGLAFGKIKLIQIMRCFLRFCLQCKVALEMKSTNNVVSISHIHLVAIQFTKLTKTYNQQSNKQNCHNGQSHCEEFLLGSAHV